MPTRTFLLTLLAVVVSGCVTHSQIDLPAFQGAAGDARHDVADLVVTNSAPEGSKDSCWLSDCINPVNPATLTGETVKHDLEAFFRHSTGATRHIEVTVTQAEVHWRDPAANKIAIVATFNIGANHEFFLDLKMQLVIKEDSQPERTLTYDKRFTVQHTAIGPGDIRDGYRQVIAQYRAEFFPQLDADLSRIAAR
jgi:hypothetical protein